MAQNKSEAPAFPEHLGTLLLRMARNAISDQLDGGRSKMQKQPSVPNEALAFLKQKKGVFVTIYHHGQLRGCIGTLESVLSLADEVVENARHAAFHDPRFSPLTEKEFAEIDLEISLLTSPVVLDFTDPEDLIKKLQPGIHGVILEKKGVKATFLPQVWDQLRDTERFLEHLCRKAGLSSHAWKDSDISIRTYKVYSFKEKHGRCH